jgi:hypothetical protein
MISLSFMMRYSTPSSFTSVAGPFSGQHPLTDLQVDRNELASLVAASRTHGDDFTLLRFLFGGIRNDDAASGLFLGIDALGHDTIV